MSLTKEEQDELQALEQQLKASQAAQEHAELEELRREKKAYEASLPATASDRLLAHPVSRLALGALEFPAGIAQFGVNLASPEAGERINALIDEVQARKRRGMRARGTEGYDWMGLAGSMAGGGVVGKGVTRLLPEAFRESTKFVPRVGRGSLQGGAIGAALPVESAGDEFLPKKAEQVLTAAAVGGVLEPVAQGLARGVAGVPEAARHTRAVLPRILGGAQVEKAGAYLAEKEAAGVIDPARRAAVADALARKRRVIADRSPTTAQVAAGALERNAPLAERASIAALEEGMSSNRLVNPRFTARADAQLALEKQEIESLAGGKTIKVAEAEREAAKKPFYEQAKREVASIDPELQEILQTRIMLRMMPEAKAEMKYRGTVVPTPPDAVSIEQLDIARRKVGEALRTSIGGEREALTTLKQRLTHWIDDHSAMAKKAREVYADWSGPVNRAHVREYLLKQLSDESVRTKPGAFLRSVQDAAKTLKTSTGSPRYRSFTEVMTPDEVSIIERVAGDMERAIMAKKPPVSATPLTPTGEVARESGNVPGVLHQEMTVLRWLLQMRGKSLHNAIAQRSADLALNPKEYIRLLRSSASGSDRDALDRLLSEHVPAAMRSYGAGAGVAGYTGGRQ